MADELTPELQAILDDANARGTLLDSHPIVLAKKRSPDSKRDLRFQYIPRVGEYYPAGPPKDWQKQ